MRIEWEHGRRGPGRSSRTLAAAPACLAMRGLCRTLLAGYLFAETAWAVGPNVYVVPINAAAAEPYDTWAKAATNIQTAVDYASTHIATYNIIIVSNGTYNITSQIAIANGITVRSFGNGVTGGLANARHTIVNGAGNHRVFYLGHSGALLDGLTIRNGRNDWGAGVYMTAGLLRNCIVKDNSCDRGGGVYVGGDVVVSNCVIRANTSTGRGGAGAYGFNNNATFINCEFTDNNHSGGDDDNGGGATYNDGGTFTFYNCLIARNRASNGGCAGCFNRGGATSPSRTARSCRTAPRARATARSASATPAASRSETALSTSMRTAQASTMFNRSVVTPTTVIPAPRRRTWPAQV